MPAEQYLLECLCELLITSQYGANHASWYEFSVFLMTCKPPLYLGPEYIKYFSDKTIDVSILCSTQQQMAAEIMGCTLV